MSIIFSEAPSKGQLHRLPSETDAISYSFSSDRLVLSAHMKDDVATVNQVNPLHRREYDSFFSNNCYNCRHDSGSRCSAVQSVGGFFPDTFPDSVTRCPAGNTIPSSNNVNFKVAPTIFQINLNIVSPRHRFESVGFSFAVLQATKVINKRIKLSRNKKPLANTWAESNAICWGGNNQPKNLRGIAKLFFEAPFNNDLVSIQQFESNCNAVKNDIEMDNFYRTYSTRYNYLADRADALYMIHAEDNVATFFWLLSAGFKPIKEAPFLILLPLTQMQIEHEGTVYHGYSTPNDACNKQWFINRSGDLLGQM